MKHATWTAPEIRYELDGYGSYDEAFRDLVIKVRETAEKRVCSEEMTELEALIYMRHELKAFITRLKPAIRFYDEQGVEIEIAQ